MKENYRQYCTYWEIPVNLVCTEENTGNSQCHQSADVTMKIQSLFKTIQICFTVMLWINARGGVHSGGAFKQGGVYWRFLPFRGAFIRGGVYSKHYGNQDLFWFLDILCSSMSFVSYSDKIICLSQLFIFQEMRYILKSTDKFPQYLLGTA